MGIQVAIIDPTEQIEHPLTSEITQIQTHTVNNVLCNFLCSHGSICDIGQMEEISN